MNELIRFLTDATLIIFIAVGGTITSTLVSTLLFDGVKNLYTYLAQ